MASGKKTGTEPALSDKQLKSLKLIPGVDTVLELLKNDGNMADIPLSVLTAAVRAAVGEQRARVLSRKAGVSAESLSAEKTAEIAGEKAGRAMLPNLDRVINATGVVIHTNLGRSLLSPKAAEHIVRVACGYSNLEFDLARGKRGIRYACVEELICELTGAEAAMAVNNNAGAVLLCLESLARDREVIVSRGELVEIGGSFRIPDVMKKSGAVLKEVGTTNRTHPRDYEEAITDNTALLMKVHTSNYSMIGFTAEVGLGDLVDLGRKHGLPVMNDLGSGTLVDFRKYGLAYEPTIQEAVAAGTDVVTFSGDKLLGGPQAGIIVGKKDILATIRKNPLTRALRIDKLTLAALEITLREYRDSDRAVETIPTLKMMTAPVTEVLEKCQRLMALLKDTGDARLNAEIVDGVSRAGGGSFPLLEIPTKCLSIEIAGLSPDSLETALRGNRPPVIGRIEKEMLLMDMRTVAADELPVIRDALLAVLNR
ncbi:MAG: L-seryl-tRNA(Sec) selenium transferase [Thermodesulfobacteriota bacterium]